MNRKPLSAIRRLHALVSVRRFALGVVTGVVLATSLLAAFTTSTEPTAHSDIGVGRFYTGGEQIDTMVITDHLYLNGPGGALFEISIGNGAGGKPVVTAAPAG